MCMILLWQKVLVDCFDRFNYFGLSRMQVSLFPTEKSVERLHENPSKKLKRGWGVVFTVSGFDKRVS